MELLQRSPYCVVDVFEASSRFIAVSYRNLTSTDVLEKPANMSVLTLLDGAGVGK